MLYWNITILEFDISIVYFQICHSVLKCNGKVQCSIFLFITATRSQCYSWGWKGPQEVSNLLFNQCSLPGCSQGFSSQLVKISEHGDVTTTLCNWWHCWTVLAAKVFWRLKFFCLQLHLLYVAGGWGGQGNWPPLDTGWLLLSVPWKSEVTFFPRWGEKKSCYLYSQGKCSGFCLGAHLLNSLLSHSPPCVNNIQVAQNSLASTIWAQPPNRFLSV